MQWWQKKVVYQIYPRSFQDSNGDGIGDIKGIISRLDYLEDLGIELLWLSPVYASPNDDNGYDISDYYTIMSEFGTMEDMDELIAEGKKRNIKLVMDLVANHTSDEHAWFIEAKAKGEKSPYYDYYVWREGTVDTLPNELMSTFGGNAWEYCEERKQYYLHLFSKKQPDLNWENADMRADIYKMICYWLDKGIAGFRLDVIDLIGKQPDKLITGNGPKLHDYIQEMTQQTFSKYDAFTVGETWGATAEIARKYSNPDKSELSMVFQFEQVAIGQEPGKSKWDERVWHFKELTDIFAKWQIQLADQGWNSLFWSNHDLPRAVSFYGNTETEEKRVLSAKMLATLLHGLQGTPYIYQGEEIGMTNVKFESIEEYDDIEILNMYNERRAKGETDEQILKDVYRVGRDNARTPMQWDTTTNAGFSKGKPWIGMNENYQTINVETARKDENSIFHHYKTLINLRKTYDVFTDGTFTELNAQNEEVFVYQRENGAEKMWVIVNTSNTQQQYQLMEQPTGEILLTNYKENKRLTTALEPFEAIIFYQKKR